MEWYLPIRWQSSSLSFGRAAESDDWLRVGDQCNFAFSGARSFRCHRWARHSASNHGDRWLAGRRMLCWRTSLDQTVRSPLHSVVSRISVVWRRRSTQLAVRYSARRVATHAPASPPRMSDRRRTEANRQTMSEWSDSKPRGSTSTLFSLQLAGVTMSPSEGRLTNRPIRHDTVFQKSSPLWLLTSMVIMWKENQFK